MRITINLLVLAALGAMVYLGYFSPRAPEDSIQKPSPTAKHADPEKVELHLIGVRAGRVLPGEDARPWWAQCKDKGFSEKECHSKLAGTRPQTAVEVVVKPLTRQALLVLMAQDKTRWDVVVEPGASVAKVILMGDGPQTITGLPKGTALEVYTREPSPCESCYQGDGGKYAHKFDRALLAVLDRVAELTGLDPTVVQLKEEGDRFFVTESMPKFSRSVFEEKLRGDKCERLAAGMKKVEEILARPETTPDAKATYEKSLKSARERFTKNQCAGTR